MRYRLIMRTRANKETRHKIDGQSSEISSQHDSLKEEHSVVRATQNKQYSDEKEKQTIPEKIKNIL